MKNIPWDRLSQANWQLPNSNRLYCSWQTVEAYWVDVVLDQTTDKMIAVVIEQKYLKRGVQLLLSLQCKLLQFI
jgi:hypothetical protein